MLTYTDDLTNQTRNIRDMASFVFINHRDLPRGTKEEDLKNEDDLKTYHDLKNKEEICPGIYCPGLKTHKMQPKPMKLAQYSGRKLRSACLRLSM